MTDIADFAGLVPADNGLCVLSTLRSDLTIQASVVNAGVLNHPATGQPVVGLVAQGRSRKLVNLRDRPQATIVVRSGWQWVAVAGRAHLIGPDDQETSGGTGGLRQLLRDVFVAAGGTHDDWDAYDRVMAAERRTAVLIAPDRVYSNR
jgi:PPOX class probable F420-dependent enzyme